MSQESKIYLGRPNPPESKIYLGRLMSQESKIYLGRLFIHYCFFEMIFLNIYT
jgi:hypothetical protein